MHEGTANRRDYKAYLLGPLTGLPVLVRGLKRDDETMAFHGAQATLLGLLFVSGTVLLALLLDALLQQMGFAMGLKGQAISIALWLLTYGWFGFWLWKYAMCIVVVRGGGWQVAPKLNNATLRLEEMVARMMGR